MRRICLTMLRAEALFRHFDSDVVLMSFLKVVIGHVVAREDAADVAAILICWINSPNVPGVV